MSFVAIGISVPNLSKFLNHIITGVFIGYAPGSGNGTRIATCVVPNTGGLDSWTTVACTMLMLASSTSGELCQIVNIFAIPCCTGVNSYVSASLFFIYFSFFHLLSYLFFSFCS